MSNTTNNNDIPLGLGMAFSQNINAMEYFSSLNQQQKQQVIDMAHNVTSKNEMRQLVKQLGDHTIQF